MAYARLVASLPAEQREELDRELGVAGWTVPGTPDPEHAGRRHAGVPAGAPAWWHGDADATASSLAAVMQARGSGRR